MTARPVPAAANSGREITVTAWKAFEKRWFSFPARGWKNAEGEQQWSPYIEFADRAAADRFRDQTLIALDKHLAALEAPR